MAMFPPSSGTACPSGSEGRLRGALRRSVNPTGKERKPCPELRRTGLLQVPHARMARMFPLLPGCAAVTGPRRHRRAGFPLPVGLRRPFDSPEPAPALQVLGPRCLAAHRAPVPVRRRHGRPVLRSRRGPLSRALTASSGDLPAFPLPPVPTGARRSRTAPGVHPHRPRAASPGTGGPASSALRENALRGRHGRPPTSGPFRGGPARTGAVSPHPTRTKSGHPVA